jgi:hypothetical protein
LDELRSRPRSRPGHRRYTITQASGLWPRTAGL